MLSTTLLGSWPARLGFHKTVTSKAAWIGAGSGLNRHWAWARKGRWGGGRQNWGHQCTNAVQVKRHGARQLTRWGNYFRHNSNILSHAWACNIMCTVRTKSLCLYMQCGKVFCSQFSTVTWMCVFHVYSDRCATFSQYGRHGHELLTFSNNCCKSSFTRCRSNQCSWAPISLTSRNGRQLLVGLVMFYSSLSWEGCSLFISCLRHTTAA